MGPITKSANEVISIPKANLRQEIVAPKVAPSNGIGALMTMIERAVVNPDFDVAKMMALLDVKERWEKTEARKAYVAAMKQFKASPPQIEKNKRVHFDTQKGPTDYKHATLDHICDVVTKGLSDVGITHAWKIKQEKDGLITVTCTLTHELGHSEDTEMMGMADTSGSKNAIQSVGSTVTYLQRYTILAACGLAARNDDTDGAAPSKGDKPVVAVEELEKNLSEIESAKSVETLKNIFGIAYAKAQDIGDRRAMAMYIQAKDNRKKGLS